MSKTQEKILKPKLGLLELAKQLGNVKDKTWSDKLVAITSMNHTIADLVGQNYK